VEDKAVGRDSFVFDDRAQRVTENALLYEIFKSLHEDKSIKVRPDSLEFFAAGNSTGKRFGAARDRGAIFADTGRF
jgi:hypothetical protein